jgi:long-subunit fatty acid transport protein
VKKYTVMDAGDFPVQSGGDTLSNRVTHELDPVLNFGLGLEHSFRETFQIYGGFATDFSARKEGTDTNLSITDWDIYSVSGGAAFSYKRFQVTLGLGYSWGGNEKSRRSVVDPGESIGFVENAEFEYRNFKALLGFAF